MRKQLWSMISASLVLALAMSAMLVAPAESYAARQAGADNKKYAGTWAGTYVSDGGATGPVAFTFILDEKGQLRGGIKFTNEEGEQKADFKSVQFTDGKLKASIESPDGHAQVAIEGKTQGDDMEGTYAVSP
ncbi:MAG TPA: hypothetical protein VFV34_15885, partial [Blastocatellia bacterium]|nr:hypothetical protein [Blastocatellia bacterium]